MHQNAFGGRPDPLGELKHSPRPLAAKKGGLLLRGGMGREWEGRIGEGKGGEGKGRGRERRGPQGLVDTPHVPNPEKKTGYNLDNNLSTRLLTNGVTVKDFQHARVRS